MSRPNGWPIPPAAPITTTFFPVPVLALRECATADTASLRNSDAMAGDESTHERGVRRDAKRDVKGKQMRCCSIIGHTAPTMQRAHTAHVINACDKVHAYALPLRYRAPRMSAAATSVHLCVTDSTIAAAPPSPRGTCAGGELVTHMPCGGRREQTHPPHDLRLLPRNLQRAPLASAAAQAQAGRRERDGGLQRVPWRGGCWVARVQWERDAHSCSAARRGRGCGGREGHHGGLALRRGALNVDGTKHASGRQSWGGATRSSARCDAQHLRQHREHAPPVRSRPASS